MVKSIRLFLLLIFCLFSVALFAQADFSATIVNHDHDDQEKVPPKIFVSKNKMRIEGAGRNGRTGVVLLDFANQTMDIIMPEQNMYMEVPAGKGPGGQRWGQFFRPRDLEDACSDWQKMATNRTGECHKVGHESVNGRDTIKYEGKSSEGKHVAVWLDPKIAFPIKWEGDKGSGELQDIKDGSLSSSLFEISAGYRKMEIPGGMPNMQPR